MTLRQFLARPACLAIALLVGVLVLAAASLFVGARSVTPAQVVSTLLSGPNAESALTPLLWSLRIPRAILALTCGAALAIAGSMSQAWTRNSLADPGIIGITAGAGFAVAIAATFQLFSPVYRITFGLVGAAVAALIVLHITRYSLDPLTLVLVGVGVSTALGAGTVILALHADSTLNAMRVWQVGSTLGRTWVDVAIATVGLVAGAAMAALVSRNLDISLMGNDVAVSLGVDPGSVRRWTAATVIVLAGAATTAVGPVAFVGLAAPHLTRFLLGPSLAKTLPSCGLIGALLTLFADCIGRVIAPPGELEVSLVLAFIGAPLLLAKVRLHKVVLR